LADQNQALVPPIRPARWRITRHGCRASCAVFGGLGQLRCPRLITPTVIRHDQTHV